MVIERVGRGVERRGRMQSGIYIWWNEREGGSVGKFVFYCYDKWQLSARGHLPYKN